MIVHPHGSVIFCDDTRQEMNGKLIFIGIYNDDVLFSGPSPWQLGGLWCHVRYHEPFPEQIPHYRIRVRLVTRSEGVTELLDVAPEIDEDMPSINAAFSFETDSMRMLTIGASIRLPPMVFHEEAKLSIVVARSETEEIFAGRLRISEIKEPAS